MKKITNKKNYDDSCNNNLNNNTHYSIDIWYEK